MSKTYYITTHMEPTGNDPQDNWAGIEARYGDGGDNLGNVPVRGWFSLAGHPEGVTVHADTGLYLTETQWADPGYLVHFTQPPNHPGFDIQLGLEYEPAA
jgi:hypothetical protein